MTALAGFDVAVAGADFSGLGMAIALEKEAKRSFVLLEKPPTWAGPGGRTSIPAAPATCPAISHAISLAAIHRSNDGDARACLPRSANGGLGERLARRHLQQQRNLDRSAATHLVLRREAQEALSAGIDARLAKSVWNAGCKSWYLSANGKNCTIWPGHTFAYRAKIRRVRIEDYVPAASPTAAE